MAREYEIKLLAEGSSFAAVVAILKSKLMSQVDGYQEGTSIDAYWKPAPGAKGNFVRMRVSSDSSVTLTSKVNDTATIEDRAEHNVDIADGQKDNLAAALTAVLGEPEALMWRYVDFRLDSVGTVVSVIQNLDKPAFTFVEVECHHPGDIAKWVQQLSHDGQLTLKQVKNSFYDIFVLKHGVRM